MQQFRKLIKSTRAPCRRLRRQQLLNILNDAQYQEKKRNIHGIYKLVDRLAPKRTQVKPQMRDDRGVLLDARQEAETTASYLRRLYVGKPCEDTLMLLPGVDPVLTAQDIYEGLRAIPVNKAGPKHLALNALYQHASKWLAPILAEFLASWWAGRVPYIPQPFKDAWLVSFFECLEKIELYCSKKNNNEKKFSELRFCEMIVLVLAFLDFSDRLQHDVFVNANNDMS